MLKKIKAAPAPKEKGNGDVGMGLHGLGTAVESIADELRPLYHIEQLSENVAELAAAVHSLAQANALSVIAKNGNQADRSVALEHLKGWFEDFRKSN